MLQIILIFLLLLEFSCTNEEICHSDDGLWKVKAKTQKREK